MAAAQVSFLKSQLEALLIFLFACLMCLVQVFCTHSPVLALLFDSQGYLAVALGLKQCISYELFHILLAYLKQGFSEACRLRLHDMALPALDLVKSGPILPSVLVVAAMICAKPLLPQHWQLFSISMILIQSLAVLAIWGYARLLTGVRSGRVASLLAIIYPGFLINSGRILSEIPATAIVIWTLFFVYWFFAKENQEKESNTFFAQLSYGFFSGILMGLMMLVRSIFLFFPIVIILTILLVSQYCKLKLKVSYKIILSGLIGMVVVLAPWVLCKQIISNQPGLTVDRNGSWNLVCGTNLNADGWDVLPAEFVSHPEKFTLSTLAATNEAITNIFAHPLTFSEKMLRKPGRLFGAPWNDFQISCLGVPWIIQRAFHQLLLLLALAGFIWTFTQALRTKNYRLLLGISLLGVLIAYHLIYCVFITMSRYFVIAMPAVIILAALAIERIRRQCSSNTILAASGGMIFFISLSTILEYVSSPGSGILTPVACCIGINTLAILSAGLLSLSLAVVLWLIMQANDPKEIDKDISSDVQRDSNNSEKPFDVAVTQEQNLPPRKLSLSKWYSSNNTVRTWIVLCVLLIPSIYLSTDNSLATIDGLITLSNSKDLSGMFRLPAQGQQEQFLILDLAFAKGKNKLTTCKQLVLALNGQQLSLPLIPLLALDTSQRENLLYLTAFAYSSGKQISDLRQWYCVHLPRKFLKYGQNNNISIGCSGDAQDNLKIFVDFANQNGHSVHTVALREFSWSKGFFADHPGEMRCDVWNENNNNKSVTPGNSQALFPRIFVLAVQSLEPTIISNNNTPESQCWTLKNQKIDRLANNWVKTIEIPCKQNDWQRDTCLNIKLKGHVCANNVSPAVGSVCLLESLGSGSRTTQQYAPLIPFCFQLNKQKQEFVAEDCLPLTDTTSDYSQQWNNLNRVKCMFAGRSWWELLGYGQCKTNSKIEFTDLTLEISPIPAFNLTTQPYQCIPVSFSL